MSKNNDDLILGLIKAKREGLKIVYGDIGHSIIVEDNHAWDLFNNTYTVVRPREFIICIPQDGRDPFVKEVRNTWTRSDFGKYSGGAEYLLMREVFVEDIK